MAENSAEAEEAPEVVANPFLLVTLNPDGVSASRPPDVLLPPNSTGPVVSKDLVFDSATGTSLRIYRPLQQETEPEQGRGSSLLPLVVFNHGGGFILFRAASAVYHAFCENMAATLSAVVVSVDYRLAPEHRLPVAYEDAFGTLRWLRDQAAVAGSDAEEELLRGVDYSRCFLTGSSSGANIVYHAGLRAASEADALSPLRVVGHVYIQPFFGGVDRTASELELENDAILPLRATDVMWELSLPVGADRGHEFCHPTVDPKSGLPRSLVTANAGDPLMDRQREFVGKLRAGEVEVLEWTSQDGFHAVELFDATHARRLYDHIRDFMYPTTPRDEQKT